MPLTSKIYCQGVLFMNFFLKICVLCFLSAFFFTFSTCYADSSTQNTAVEQKTRSTSPTIFFPAQKYTFDQVVDGTKIVHNFVVKNRGDAVLKIQKVKTG